jgi:predicted transcriptional regulator
MELTLSVASREEVTRRALAAMAGADQGAHLSFENVEQLWRTLSPKRWDILKAMTGQGELSIRDVARRVGRDVKAVHSDVTGLILAGVIERGARGVCFPYDAVHVDFTLQADVA